MTTATQQYEAELISITESVWSSLLDLPLDLRVPGQSGPNGGHADGRSYTGIIHVTGSWEGAVTVHCSEVLARIVTAAMFGTEPHETSSEEVADALGELANMVGGNVKALLPEGCRISLPTVADGIRYRLSVPGTVPLTAVTWTCQGEPLMVRILERAS